MFHFNLMFDTIQPNSMICITQHDRIFTPLRARHCGKCKKWVNGTIKGPYQCYHMLLSFVNIGHAFSRNTFIYEKSGLFTFCQYSVNVTQSAWKCVTILGNKNICVKILLHANIQARKAALVRNYFSRCNNFLVSGYQLPSLSFLLSDFLTK